jgi:hypothetical protein
MAKNLLNIDDHYLRYPKNEWGGTDLNNPDMIDPWIEMQEMINPKKVIEIGMWAGHASLVMMTVFKNLESLVSYDPHPISKRNARQIKKHWPQHTFYQEPIWSNEHRHTDIDLIFVDGKHTGESPKKDLKSCKRIYNLFDIKYDPQYYFYTNIKYSSVAKYYANTPGIMGLFKMEGHYDSL